MDMLKKFFPYSFAAKNSIAVLVINIIIQVVVGAVVGLLISILSGIPIIGFLFSLVGWLVELYVFIGIVLSCLDYFKLLK